MQCPICKNEDLTYTGPNCCRCDNCNQFDQSYLINADDTETGDFIEVEDNLQDIAIILEKLIAIDRKQTDPCIVFQDYFRRVCREMQGIEDYLKL